MQVPLQTAHELTKAGHEVFVIATERVGADVVLPELATTLSNLVYISESRRRGAVGSHRRTVGYNAAGIVRQLRDLRRVAKANRLDVLHLIGYERMVRMGGLLRQLRFPCEVVVSALGPPASSRWDRTYRLAGRVVCSTEFAAQQWSARGVRTVVARHGSSRDIRSELLPEHRSTEQSSVVYWRIATHDTGGDLVASAFERLVKQFPAMRFRMILRDAPQEVPGLEGRAANAENWTIDRFPYPTEGFLAEALSDAKVCLFPYRDNTVDPQLSIAETLDFGVPCVVSDVRSNPELVEDGVTGVVCADLTVDGLVAAVVEAIESRALLRGDELRNHYRNRWGWDSYCDLLVERYEMTA